MSITEAIRITRTYAMPSKDTFSIKPIKDLAKRYYNAFPQFSTRDEILDLLDIFESMSVSQLADQLCLAWTTIDYHVRKLERMGEVTSQYETGKWGPLRVVRRNDNE